MSNVGARCCVPLPQRRLLADQTTMALAGDADPKIAAGLIRADALAASGRLLESLVEVTRVYEAGLKVFENK